MLIVLLFHSEISSTCQLRIFTEMDADLDEVLLDGPWRSQHGYFSLPAVRAGDLRRVEFSFVYSVLETEVRYSAWSFELSEEGVPLPFLE